jgi:hypothetical protein
MLILSGSADSLQVATDVNSLLRIHASYVDLSPAGVVLPGRQNTLITGSTLGQNIISAPGTGILRNVKLITLHNENSSSVGATLVYSSSATPTVELYSSTLGPRAQMQYVEDSGFSNNASTDSGILPSWHGKLYAGYGRCDPQQMLRMAQMAGTIAATPTNIGATVARIAYFRPPADITVSSIRFFGVGSTTNIYTCAIYDGDTLARLTNSLTFSTTAATWGTAGTGLNLTLLADQLYFIAVSANTTGTTAGMLCMSPTIAATTGLIGVLPKSWPGSLAVSSGYIDGGFAQFTVVAGAMPNPAATIAVQAAWTGGFPAFFLDYV